MRNTQTYVKINLDNLIHNFKNIKQNMGDATVIPIIKADAYGHGSVVCARALIEEFGVDLFAVSSVYEAMCLIEENINAKILILGYVPDVELDTIVRNDIVATIYNLDFAKKLNQTAKKYNKKAAVHIKINSGMNRLGFNAQDLEETVQNIEEIYNLENLEVQGIFTHFATSDEVSKEFSKEQYKRFDKLLKDLDKRKIKIPMKHISNSAAITDLDYPMDAVRAGLVLYGVYPSSVHSDKENDYKPVMSFITSVSNILTLKKGESVSYGRTYTAKEDEQIAVICAGYADGYNRKLSNKAKVLLPDGKKADVIGTICMDMCMIKLPKNSEVKVGDKVELFGENIDLRELADICGTIPYELLCCMNKRVKRLYIENNKVSKKYKQAK